MPDLRKTAAAGISAFNGLAANAIARNIVGVMGLKVAALGLGFLVNVVLARRLAPEGFGRYAFAFTFVTLISMPVRSGFGMLMVREVAVYHKRAQWPLLKGILKASNSVALAVSIISVAVLLVVGARNPDSRSLWAWSALLVPLYSLGGLRGCALRGLLRPMQGQLPEDVLRPALLLGFLLVWSAFSATPLDSGSAMGLHAAAMAVAFLSGVWMLLRALPREIRNVPAAYAWPEWSRALLPFTLLAGIQVLNGSLDVIMLGFLSTPNQVGQFRAAEQFASLVGFSMLAVNMVLTPQLARCFAVKDMDRAQRLVRKSALATAVLALPVAAIFWMAGGHVLSLTYGPQFASAWPALAILSAASFVAAICGPVGAVMNMAGFERESVRAVLAALVVNALLNLWLVPKFGATGAAVGTAASIVSWNLLLAWRVRMLTGLSATAAGGPRKALP